jgi:hypothetical protein
MKKKEEQPDNLQIIKKRRFRKDKVVYDKLIDGISERIRSIDDYDTQQEIKKIVDRIIDEYNGTYDISQLLRDINSVIDDDTFDIRLRQIYEHDIQQRVEEIMQKIINAEDEMVGEEFENLLSKIEVLL